MRNDGVIDSIILQQNLLVFDRQNSDDCIQVYESLYVYLSVYL